MIAARLAPLAARVPLRYRLSLAASVLIGIACTSLYLYVPARLHRQGIAALSDKAETIARMSAYSAAPAVLFNDEANIADVVVSAGRDRDLVQITVKDGTGRVVGTRRFNAGIARAGTVDHTASIEHLGRPIGSVRVVLSANRVETNVAATRIRLAVTAILLFIVALIGAFGVSTLVTGPLSAVANAVAAIAAGGALTRVHVRSRDEIGMLADTFNLMIDRLETAHAELRASNSSLEQRVQERTAELEHEVRERRRADVQLRASEQRLRAIFESAGIGIAVLDADGQILSANHALQQSLSAAHLLDRRFSDLLDGACLSRFEEDRRAVLSGASPCTQAELMVNGGTRTLPMVCTLSAVRDPAAAPYLIALLKDVTEQRALEEQYRESQKLGAIGRLAGGVAHDFNNLLTTINGVADLLLDRTSGDTRRDVEEIKLAGARAAQLTRQLLAFSRRQVLQPQVVQLNDIVTDTTRMLRRIIGEHIAIELDLDPGTACVLADSGQIVQVLMNLAVNARDAMPHGGTIDIVTSMAHVDDTLGERLDLPSRGPHVQLIVRDTGKGMDAATLALAFEPFFTTKPVGEGTGLGLATVYGIVRQSSGAITVASTPGVGTTFRILLPAVAEQTPAAPRTQVTTAAERRAATVLVVEDESSVRSLITRVLRKGGYQIREAHDGATALELARRHGDEIDVLLTDVVMPNMGGVELAHLLRAEHPRMRIVFMSGYTPDEVREGADIAEADLFLEKPMSPAALLRAIDAVLDSAPVAT